MLESTEAGVKCWKMSAKNRLVEYFLVAGVDSSKEKESERHRTATTSSTSLPPPTSPLAAAITEREDGKIVYGGSWRPLGGRERERERERGREREREKGVHICSLHCTY